MTGDTAAMIAFTEARLAEREAAAMAATGTAWAWEATGDKDSSWAVGHVEDEDGRPLSGQIEKGQGAVIDGVCESINGRLADAAHIAMHNPASVLRDIAAKRRILEDCMKAIGPHRALSRHACHDVPYDAPHANLAYRTIRSLASGYDTHPDWRPEWAPER